MRCARAFLPCRQTRQTRRNIEETGHPRPDRSVQTLRTHSRHVHASLKTQTDRPTDRQCLVGQSLPTNKVGQPSFGGRTRADQDRARFGPNMANSHVCVCACVHVSQSGQDRPIVWTNSRDNGRSRPRTAASSKSTHKKETTTKNTTKNTKIATITEKSTHPGIALYAGIHASAQSHCPLRITHMTAHGKSAGICIRIRIRIRTVPAPASSLPLLQCSLSNFCWFDASSAPFRSGNRHYSGNQLRQLWPEWLLSSLFLSFFFLFFLSLFPPLCFRRCLPAGAQSDAPNAETRGAAINNQGHMHVCVIHE